MHCENMSITNYIQDVHTHTVLCCMQTVISSIVASATLCVRCVYIVRLHECSYELDCTEHDSSCSTADKMYYSNSYEKYIASIVPDALVQQ
jgi:hypothetical protein